MSAHAEPEAVTLRRTAEILSRLKPGAFDRMNCRRTRIVADVSRRLDQARGCGWLQEAELYAEIAVGDFNSLAQELLDTCERDDFVWFMRVAFPILIAAAVGVDIHHASGKIPESAMVRELVDGLRFFVRGENPWAAFPPSVRNDSALLRRVPGVIIARELQYAELEWRAKAWERNTPCFSRETSAPKIEEDYNDSPAVTTLKEFGTQAWPRSRPTAEPQSEKGARRESVVRPFLKAAGVTVCWITTASGIGKSAFYDFLKGKRNFTPQNRKAVEDVLQDLAKKKGLAFPGLPE